MTDVMRRHPSAWGRSLAALGSVALAAVCAAGAAALWASFWRRPFPEPCSLLPLPVPRPGDLQAWSPDSAQLLTANRNGEAWVVHFPDRSVRILPYSGQAPRAAAWDAAGHPLLTYPAGKIVSFNTGSDSWRTLPVRGDGLVVSPDGRWIAGLRGSGKKGSGTGRVTTLLVWDAVTGALADRCELLGRSEFAVEWTDAGELVASERHVPPRKQMAYRMVAGSLRAAAPSTAARNKVRAEYVALVIPGERTREQARQVLHLHNGPPPAADWHLWLRRHGTILQDIPLGRRVEGRSGSSDYHTWKCASVSPDGRYVVVRAADDTQRLLELRHP